MRGMTLNDIFDQHRSAVQARFDARYREDQSGCWIWTDTLTKDGYASFYISNYRCLGHRVSFALKNGPVPDGMLVCHKCDVTACVNPDHLFLGSYFDNNADRSAKRRTHQPFGVSRQIRKLTLEQVLLIKTDARSSLALAKLFGVSRTTVAKVRRGDTWTHVLPPNDVAAQREAA